MSRDISAGHVVWINLSPTLGREQRGHRPAVIVSSRDHLAIVNSLAIIVPCTSTSLAWPNHVELEGPTGLREISHAMTEQPRTVTRTRITEVAGTVGKECLAEIIMWLNDWIQSRSSSA